MSRASSWTSRFANRAALRAAVAIALAPALVLLVTGVPMSRTIEPQQIAAESGHAYHATVLPWRLVWPLSIKLDTSDAPTQSNAQVYESGRALGPAHTAHDQIRSIGRGRYSHWGIDRSVYFSSSDNTDPRTNGRTYAIRVRAALPWWRWLIAGALLACVAWLLKPAVAASMASLTAGAKSVSLRYPRLMDRLRHTEAGLAGVGRVLRRGGALVVPSLAGIVGPTLLIGALGEAYFRSTVPFAELKWPSRYVQGVGWLFEPNAVVRHSNFLDFWIEDTTNSLGFLDREPSPADAANSCRVAIVGDSFVEAAQVHNVDKVQSVLERRAKEGAAPLRISAAAYGFSGTGQLNQLPFYNRYAAKTRPHLVVLVFVTNDFANNSAILEAVRNGFHPKHPPRLFATRDADGQMRLLEPDPDWQKFLIPTGDDVVPPPCKVCERHTWLVSKSLFYRWITFKLRLLAPKLLTPLEPRAAKSLTVARVEWLSAQEGLAAKFGNWDGDAAALDFTFYKPDLAPVFREALEFTEFGLAEWKRRVESNGGKLVLLSGSRVRTTDTPKSPDDDLYFGRMRAIADKLGIPVLDQYAWLKRHNEPLSGLGFRHDGHWTVRGHQVAAEMILGHLRSDPAICAAAMPPQPNQ
jgi:hypothetical protein